MASVKCCFRGWETGPGVEEFQVSGNREQDGTSTSNKEKKKKALVSSFASPQKGTDLLFRVDTQ